MSFDWLRRISTGLEKVSRLVVRPRQPALFPAFVVIYVVIIDSGVLYTISKSYIFCLSPVSFSCMFLHTIGATIGANMRIDWFISVWFTMALCYIELACRVECMPS